jgi:hypothetical protein
VNGACITSSLQHCWLEGHVPKKLRLAVCCKIDPGEVRIEVQPKTSRDVVTKHIDDASWGPSCCFTGSGNDTTKITIHVFVQNTLVLMAFSWGG